MFCRNVLAAIAVISAFVGSAFAENVTVNLSNRNMLVYAPSGIEKGRPLIIQMHGMNQDAAYQKNAAKWEGIADTARFVVVFPNGENKSWDISGDKDVNFLKSIISEMGTRYGISKKRVYVSGFSMGGMMSYHAANKMGDMIAAIAPCSGYPMGNPAPASKRMMPIIHTHGTTDDVVNYNSGVSYLKRWVEYEGCSSASEKISPYPAGRSGSAASLEKWTGCKNGSEIRLMSIAGKGHWYSMDLASVNTSDEIWNFVKRFSLDGAAEETPAEPSFVEPTNRDSIYNGCFDSTANAWTLQTHGNASAIGAVKDGKYSLDISAVGAEPYTVQVIQHNLHLEKDQWYEIAFDASAVAARTLEVNVEQHVDPWGSYLKEKQNFDLSTATKTYSFKFQMTAATDTNSRLSFNAGGAAVNMSIDNVSLQKIAAPADEPDPNQGGSGQDGIASPEGLGFAAVQTCRVYSLSGSFLGQFRAADLGEIQSKTRNLVKKSGIYIVRSFGVIWKVQVH